MRGAGDEPEWEPAQAITRCVGGDEGYISLMRWRLGAAACALSLACGGATSPPQQEPDGAVGAIADATVDVAEAGYDAADAGNPADVGGDMGDAPLDAVDGAPESDGGTVYGDMTDASSWSTFDMTQVSANARGFAGGTFDGRYIYFAPGLYGVVPRYDTTAPFGAASSWSTFDATIVDPDPTGFFGAVFDGRYVYFVPSFSGPAQYGSHVTRYDTHGTFTAIASWVTFDTTTINPNAKGFAGAVFDGRYAYFAPGNNGLAPNQVITRYDTQEIFTAAAGWSTFPCPSPGNGWGGVFDGRYVYFLGTLVNRYDTQGGFDLSSSWSLVSPPSSIGGGGGFDGRYLYAASDNSHAPKVEQYDTQAVLGDAASWSTFPVSGGAGVAFDGRYVYVLGQPLSRYDTRASFTAYSSWSTFDVTTLGGIAAYSGFTGAVFDCRYVYLVPSLGSGSLGNGVAARFDAKSPPSMPKLPGWNGSFL